MDNLIEFSSFVFLAMMISWSIAALYIEWRS